MEAGYEEDGGGDTATNRAVAGGKQKCERARLYTELGNRGLAVTGVITKVCWIVECVCHMEHSVMTRIYHCRRERHQPRPQPREWHAGIVLSQLVMGRVRDQMYVSRFM
ncbi:MAG: hypothetical protein UX59_C0002G0011 [Microgenomates group bacterium GW2011_GWA1_46_7]|nr:MAG: hypothetical protein UX59_C0002G0011 [Microgenomates group bacterium GW2011_GWA1_46_7]